MISWKLATTRNFSTTNLSSFILVFFSFRNMNVVPHDYQIVKNQNFFEWVNDRNTCPAIQGFVWSIPNSDRPLSVDRHSFEALHCLFMFFFFSGLKNNKYTSGKSTYLNLGEATSGESTFGRNSLLPFGWLVAGGSTITSFEVLKGYYNMMPSVKWQTFNNLRSEQIS